MNYTAHDPKRRRAGALQTPRKSAFICGLFCFLLLTATSALAQGGGKAEPNRIEFKPGHTSATFNDYVRNSEQAEYVLSAPGPAADDQAD